jgi:superfamily II DNA or RNA helicase
MKDYTAFLDSKKLVVSEYGIAIQREDVHPALFEFQRDIVVWAVKRGRAAIFADVGLGKTAMQLEWARQLNVMTLIVAPLAVAQQTVRQARLLLDMEVRYVRSQAEVAADCRFYITNYEMIEHFDPAAFEAVVLDESSILKAFSGVTKKRLVAMFSATRYRLACTATPAPNDLLEIGNHADFLGVMSSRLMTSIFFAHESQGKKNSANKYRLKRHAVSKFYEWLASWAVALKKPSDLGYSDVGYDLPELKITLQTVDGHYTEAGVLPGFSTNALSAVAAKKVRRATIESRASVVISQVTATPAQQYIIWTGLNDEAAHLHQHIADSANLHGSLSPDEKVQLIDDFVSGRIRVLITKSSIAGMGVNMQNCARMIFCGLDYSWEQFYQSIGRIYRFGQQADSVQVTVVISEQERSIYDEISRKGQEARRMTDELIKSSQAHMTGAVHGAQHANWQYQTADVTAPSGKWRLLLGDSCERMREIATDSVHLSVYSPPFGGTIYIYSATERDLGNSRTNDEFLEHYRYIVRETLRVTLPGRYTCVHIQDTKLYANRDGARGIYPLSDEIVRLHLSEGWTYRARITIDKNPQAVATRNHDNDLLFITGQRDGCDLAPMNTDYLLVFEKPGDNPVPTQPYQNGEMSEQEWCLWARAIWYDIRETDVLNVDVARSDEDERHLCPLQLPLIMRCVKMWSNPGELVFTPFAGIGSEMYEAVRWRRRALGIELKPEYHRVAVRNLNACEALYGGKTLFDLLDTQAAGD